MHFNRRGMTLVEALVGLFIATALFGSLMVSAMSIRSLASMNRHYIQAVNVARGAIETIRGQGIGAAVDSSWSEAFDAGRDGIFGSADDLTGTVTIRARDFLDMDQDGITGETSIDLDGNGTNDAARPIRASFQWSERVAGTDKGFTVWLDSLIVA